MTSDNRNGGASQVQCTREIERVLGRRLLLERLAAEIAADLAGCVVERIDDVIKRALKKLAGFAGAVRGSLFMIDERTGTLNNSHEWVASAEDSIIDAFQQVSAKRFPFYLAGLMDERTPIRISREGDLPEGATGERQWIADHGFRSLVLVPLYKGEAPQGALGVFGPRGAELAWPDELVDLMSFVGSIFVNALVRKEIEAALKETEEKFTRVFQHAPLPMTISSLKDGEIIEANRAYLTETGFEKEAIIGRTSSSIGFLSFRERERVVAALNAPSAEPVELNVRSADGLSHVVLWTGHVIRFDGEPRLLSTALDITQQKLDAVSRERTIALLEVLNRSSGIYELISDVMQLMKGWSGCETVGIRLKEGRDYPFVEIDGASDEASCEPERLCEDRVWRQTADGLKESDRLACICGCVIQGRGMQAPEQVTESGSFWTGRLSQILSDKNHPVRKILSRNRCRACSFESMALIPIRHGEKTLGMLQLGDRRPEMFAEADIELFERLTANLAIGLSQRFETEARKEAEAQLNLALQGADADRWEMNFSDDTVTSTVNWGRRFGYEGGEHPIPFARLRETTHPDDRARNDARMAAHLAGKSDRYETESRFQRKDGSYVWVRSRGKVVEWDRAGKPRRLVGINFDIDESKRAEEAQQQMQIALMQSQKMESVGRLAGGVAHDFNNMLGVILGHAELALTSSARGGDVTRHLSEIKLAARRSAELTRQLLTFARKQAAQPRVLDINGTVENMVGMLGRLIGEDISLIWAPGDEVWPVEMDPSQFDQILTNLSINARDAIDGVGTITIATQNVSFAPRQLAALPDVQGTEFLKLTVRDTGRGMSEETKSCIFEPFFTTKGFGEGTGLGLATVYGVVKQSNGFIRVDSALGKGTSFAVFLPRFKGSEERAVDPGDSRRRFGGKETILLVEDEPALLELGRTMLAELGYRVLAATRAREALSIARSTDEEIHLLLTDVVMPQMNGRELAQRLKEHKPTTKTLFMSGYTANVLAEKGIADKSVDFIQKPFTIPELSKRVREVLDRAGGPNAAQTLSGSGGSTASS